MARGKHKLYNSFNSRQAVPAEERRLRNHFQPERNIALTHRYYFYLMIVGSRYELILAALEREFYLSQAHISNLLSREPQHSLLQELVERGLTVRELAQLYPHWVWRFAPGA